MPTLGHMETNAKSIKLKHIGRIKSKINAHLTDEAQLHQLSSQVLNILIWNTPAQLATGFHHLQL